jgi:hypothetical protein
MTQKKNAGISASLVVLAAISITAPAHAQFEKLKDKLNKLAAPQAGGAQAVPAAAAAPQAGAAPAPAPASGSTKAGPSTLGNPDSWCKQQTALLAGKKANTDLIKEEFKVANLESLQDEFIDRLARPSASKAFVGASYWRSSFETVKVRALYDSFLAFPEPDVLAVLIEMSRKASDQQEKNDARMALAFLHFAVPEMSVNSNRGMELFQSAGSDHWTALVFKARLNGYGEEGVKQNVQAALGYLVQAGSKKNEYMQSRGRFEWDKNNYEVPYNRLAFAITASAPGKYPAWEQFNPTLQKIDAAQANYMARWPTTRAGKFITTAMKSNDESLSLGEQVIKMSQSGNANEGALANIQSLRAAKTGDKQTFVSIDPKAEAMMLKMMRQSGDLNGEQIKLLAQAQAKRYEAQGLIAQVQMDLASQLFGGTGTNQNGEDDLFVRAGMLLPAMAQAQEALILSCVISTKWEQAMRAKNMPVVDKKEAAKTLSQKYAAE